jgi:hypothetical protein
MGKAKKKERKTGYQNRLVSKDLFSFLIVEFHTEKGQKVRIKDRKSTLKGSLFVFL